MKWWGYLILLLVIAGFLTYYLMKFRNKVVNQKEDIEKAKSRVRILKAKYLQVLRKVGTTQKDSNDAQGGAYYTANKNGGGRFIGGAIGAVDSNSTTSNQGIMFSGGKSVIISYGNGDSSIDTERGYAYQGARLWLTAAE